MPTSSYDGTNLEALNVLEVGDSIVITSPSTSQTIYASIASIISAFDASSNTIIIELTTELNTLAESANLFFTTNYLESV